MMSDSLRSRPIQRQVSNRPFTPQTVLGNVKVIRTGNKIYKINRQPIFINRIRKTMVFLLETSDGKKYVGKLIRTGKIIQAITQAYFLKKLKGNSICNFVDFANKPQGIWVITEKGHTSLYNYLDRICKQQVEIILKNIAISYLTFYENGIAHRDLKPGNIIIEQNLDVKIIDLQLCQKFNQKFGTQPYIPPYIKCVTLDSNDSFAYGLIVKQLTQKCGLIDQKWKELIRNCMSHHYFKKWGWKEIYQFWNITPQIKTQIKQEQQQE